MPALYKLGDRVETRGKSGKIVSVGWMPRGEVWDYNYLVSVVEADNLYNILTDDNLLLTGIGEVHIRKINI